MIVSIHQPYLFPYLGYFQLIYNSDIFVVYDDVTFIKGGFINRNNILSSGRIQRFTLPIESISSNSYFKDLYFTSNTKKLIRTIEQSYSKSPFFHDVMPLIKDIFNYSQRNVSTLCMYSYEKIFEYLGIIKNMTLSSELDYLRLEDKTGKVISICEIFDADEYVNASGGIELYDTYDFKKNNLSLGFLKKEACTYTQNSPEFIDNLSIIDVLMNNSKSDILNLLSKYEVVGKDE
ncbi:WbqC family protein [Moritella sp. 36]|uniref:WbqC family protein n=1 Tax=Moritella sp. 36 TaxID=2746233 RepID=UPI001BAB7ABC|nr:WbqC family protein [Moritella sp. 36]QUM87861.1 WbqC family protein [Moritella sp. 36]